VHLRPPAALRRGRGGGAAAARAWATLASVEAAGGAPAAASPAALGSLRLASPCVLDSCASVLAPAWCGGGSGWPRSAPSGIQQRRHCAGRLQAGRDQKPVLFCFVLFEPARARRGGTSGRAWRFTAVPEPILADCQQAGWARSWGPGAAERAPHPLSSARTSRRAQPPCPAPGRGPCGGAPRSQAPPGVRVSTWSALGPGRSGSGAPNSATERPASPPQQPTGLAAALPAARRADRAAREGPSARRVRDRAERHCHDLCQRWHGPPVLEVQLASVTGRAGQLDEHPDAAEPWSPTSTPHWAGAGLQGRSRCSTCRHAALCWLARMQGGGGQSASQRARGEVYPATHARRRAAGRGQVRACSPGPLYQHVKARLMQSSLGEVRARLGLACCCCACSLSYYA